MQCRDFLNEEVQSILNHTYKNFEFIIINDGSTDEYFSIAQKYKMQGDRIMLIAQEYVGMISSLNKGIALSKGKLIERMDADDISLEKRFNEQVKLLESGDDLCRSHYQFIIGPGKLSNSLVVSSDSQFQWVISNFTFSSWWAWLNTNPEKRLIAPQQWFKTLYDSTYIAPE